MSIRLPNPVDMPIAPVIIGDLLNKNVACPPDQVELKLRRFDRPETWTLRVCRLRGPDLCNGVRNDG